jgi:ribosomal-protein-alanine N-acetyltransferase
MPTPAGNEQFMMGTSEGRAIISDEHPLVYSITLMTARDLPAVAEIDRMHQREPWSESAFREELHKLHALCFVARLAPSEGGQSPRSPSGVIGYICSWVVVDELQILNVTVERGLWRRGIGRALLRQAIDAGWQKGCIRATLEVRPSNTAARGLYDSLGFRVVGERPGFYAEGREAGMIMELERGY